MARNPLYTKLVKQRKEWRSRRPKTFVKVRGGVNRMGVQVETVEGPARDPEQWFNYRQRAKGLGEQLPRPRSGMSDQSLDTLEAIILEAMRLTPHDEVMYVAFRSGRKTYVRMYFTRDLKTFWVEEKRGTLWRKSILYPSSEYTKQKYIAGEIRWDGGWSRIPPE